MKWGITVGLFLLLVGLCLVTPGKAHAEGEGFVVSNTSGLRTTESGGTVTFTIKLNSSPTSSVYLGLYSSNTSEGTVFPSGVNFIPLNWNISRTVTVTGVDDFVVDGDQTYCVYAIKVTSDPNYSSLDFYNIYVINEDNDPGITVSPTSGLVTTEAGGTATFTIKLNSPPAANVVINLSSNDTTEGTVSPSNVTFTTSNWNTPRTITVTGVNDTLTDGNISYSIVTAASSSTDTNYNALEVADVSVTNAEAAPGFTVNPTSGLVTTEAGGSATFTIKLTSRPEYSVSIGLSSSDTGEGTVAPSSVTFSTANWNTSQTVTVTGVDDASVDGNISYSIVTAASNSTDTRYNNLTVVDVGVTNTDNDAAGIILSPDSGLVTTEAGGNATFNIKLSSQPAANVSIGLSSSDTTEGTVSPSSVIFTASNWSTNQTVTVTGVNDDVIDGNISYSIVTAAASSTDTSYNNLNAVDVSVTNTDMTAPTPTISFNIGGTNASWNTSSDGVIQQAVNITSADNKINMYIPEGTTALNNESEPLDELNMSGTTVSSSILGGRNVIAAFDFDPDGATFNPGIVVTLSYTPDMIPAGMNESSLTVALYNASAKGWEYIDDCVVNAGANTITFTVRHFTIFTVQTPPVRQESSGLATWAVILIIFFVAIVLGVVGGLYIKYKRIYGSLYYEDDDEYYDADGEYAGPGNKSPDAGSNIQTRSSPDDGWHSF